MKTRRLLDALEFYYDNFDVAQGCAEPGYDNKPVILADWNRVPDKLFSLLEKYGYSCEWEDEWLVCDSCYYAFRCSPNSYGWQMYGYIGDGFAVCGDCIDWDEYLEGLENNPRKAVTSSLLYGREAEITSRYDLVKEGFESGLHPGQNDNPSAILAALLQDNPDGKYIFVMDGQGQIDLEFSVYIKKGE